MDEVEVARIIERAANAAAAAVAKEAIVALRQLNEELSRQVARLREEKAAFESSEASQGTDVE